MSDLEYQEVLVGGSPAGELVEGQLFDRLAGEWRAAGLPLNAWSNVLSTSIVAKSGRATLFGFTVYNSNAAAQFIQWHDAQTLPADGAVPAGVISVAGSSDRTISWVIPGRFFSRGIVLCNSSTAATKTVGAADCLFDVQYI